MLSLSKHLLLCAGLETPTEFELIRQLAGRGAGECGIAAKHWPAGQRGANQKSGNIRHGRIKPSEAGQRKTEAKKGLAQFRAG